MLLLPHDVEVCSEHTTQRAQAGSYVQQAGRQASEQQYSCCTLLS